MSGFREIVKREAGRRGLSCYRLGKMTGLRIRSIQAYFAGKTDMTGERLAKLCDALDLELRRKQTQRKRR